MDQKIEFLCLIIQAAENGTDGAPTVVIQNSKHIYCIATEMADDESHIVDCNPGTLKSLAVSWICDWVSE